MRTHDQCRKNTTSPHASMPLRSANMTGERHGIPRSSNSGMLNEKRGKRRQAIPADVVSFSSSLSMSYSLGKTFCARGGAGSSAA
jgi:hypothetical protein